MKKSDAPARILLIEDEREVAEVVEMWLRKAQYVVETAPTAEQGITRAQTTDFDVVLTDLKLPDKSGLDVITTLRPNNPHLPIILITGHHTTDRAIEATKHGAYDYFTKPINWGEVLPMIQQAVETGAQFRTSRLTKDRMPLGEETLSVEKAIVGRSAAMQNVYKEIGRVAARPVTVLIRGETGTGKELVAWALFNYSDRVNHPFIIVNCVAIPETLLESELFGHEQGAFTGAHTRKIGKFERANQGTIFLDEIGDMTPGTQAKLLRVLQERVIQRVGGKETISVDVRLIAATHRDLEKAVEEKKFREDLYYRLNDAVIRLPSLRERREDISDLVRYFLHWHGAELAGSEPTITDDALQFLKYRSWPGNVRQLRNVVHKSLVLSRGYSIDREVICQALKQVNPTEPESKRSLQAHVAELLGPADSEALTDLQAALTDWVERELYSQAIRLAEGDQTKVAKWLGVSRPTVRERLLRYDLHPGSERTPHPVPLPSEGERVSEGRLSG